MKSRGGPLWFVVLAASSTGCASLLDLSEATQRIECVNDEDCASSEHCDDGECESNGGDEAPLVPCVDDSGACDLEGGAPSADASLAQGPWSADASVGGDEPLDATVETAVEDDDNDDDSTAGDDDDDDDSTPGDDDVPVACIPGAVRACGEAGLDGPCASGEQVCEEDGQWGGCDVQPAGADTCEPGNDDNCNGTTNDGCPCAIGDVRSCADGRIFGACAQGEQVCGADAVWGPCSIEPLDGDDCTEANDGNCNGVPNEGCECVIGDERACAEALGTCAEGAEVCQEPGLWGPCSVLPLETDTCEPGNDDNCNGAPNDGCCEADTVRYCAEAGIEGNCAAGVQTCGTDGNWGACDILPASADTCEPGDDSNCNGLVNEGCACTEEETRPCSESGALGTCAEGVETCTAGVWGDCSIAPSAEDGCVDGNDDDCDGMENEGCACEPGETRFCSAGGFFGKCANGTQTCSAQGDWGVCSIAPSATDSCTSGNDDNCNGEENEGCTCLNGDVQLCSESGALGVCAAGTQTCISGNWAPCSIAPTTESCASDGKDEDCDGSINETPPCSCVNGTTRTCAAGGLVGPCSTGTQTCLNGSWSGCSIAPATYDSCATGDDANCNGVANSPLDPSCDCIQGATRSCGPCNDGTETCSVTGEWSCAGASSQVVYYRDSDNDTFGDPNVSQSACSQPTGYVTNNTDCCDADNRAKPGQTTYYPGARTGCGGYDYDCVNGEEQRWPNLGCNQGGGWAGPVPACGQEATWLSTYCYGPYGCTYCVDTNYTPRQECR